MTDEWQDIHTAPHDGTPVWIYCEDGEISIATYRQEWDWKKLRIQTYWDSIFSPRPLKAGIAVLKWYPLPKPPPQEQSTEKKVVELKLVDKP